MASYYACVVAGILVTGVAQVLLRLGSGKPAKGLVAAFLRREVLLGYALFFGVTLVNVYAMRVIPLKTMTAWSSLTYPWVMVLAAVLLRERITRRMAAGCLLIVLGMVIFSLASAAK